MKSFVKINPGFSRALKQMKSVVLGFLVTGDMKRITVHT